MSRGDYSRLREGLENLEMARILTRYGFARNFEDASHIAARLQREGMGPYELEDRAKNSPTAVGGLTYTHRIAKVARDPRRRDPARSKRAGFAAGHVQFERVNQLLEHAMKRAERRGFTGMHGGKGSVFDDPDVKRLMKRRDALLKRPR